MLQQIHFIQPLWLLALLPLSLLLWLAFRSGTDSKSWEKIIDAKLLPLLLQGEDRNTGKLAKFLLASVWFICVIALADPVWEKIPRPIFQTNSARVLVLDLSNSMLIDDLKPNRLARARFKIEDILSREEEGQTGLVLFAGDAFTASPLTRDTETIRSFLKVLTPQLMPAQGSRVDLGLIKAHELLKQSGATNGQVLLIADGVSKHNAAIEAASDLLEDGHSVSVLGVGTEEGGELKFRNNQTVSIKLESDALRNIASSGGGLYHLISTNNADLQNVLVSMTEKQSSQKKNELKQQELTNEEWKSSGSFLALLLLPFAALAFRRGWLLNLFFAFVLVGLTLQPQTAMAFPLEKQWQNIWSTLSQNKEQRADIALRQQQYEDAEVSSNPLRRGSAEYKQKKYSQALESFQQAEGADARYNEANTLVKLKKYKEALAAYDEALKLQKGMKDAIENKKAIEELLKNQQSKSNDSKDKSDDKKQQKDTGTENKQKDSEGQQSKDDNSDKQEDQQSDKSQQQEGKQSNSEDGSKQSREQQKTSENEEKKDQYKDKKNQFSDANKDLEKNSDEKLAQEDANSEQAQQGKPEDPKKTAEDTLTEKGDPTQQKDKDINGTKEEAEELTKEEKMAAEQWLRRIPDDPGGLLRRKFRSQYQRRRSNINNSEQPW